MSWLIWLRQASSASSHAAGWNAARMAEKNGEGGGEAFRSTSPKLKKKKKKRQENNLWRKEDTEEVAVKIHYNREKQWQDQSQHLSKILMNFQITFESWKNVGYNEKTLQIRMPIFGPLSPIFLHPRVIELFYCTLFKEEGWNLTGGWRKTCFNNIKTWF